jgi:hypothetical protein
LKALVSGNPGKGTRRPQVAQLRFRALLALTKRIGRAHVCSRSLGYPYAGRAGKAVESSQWLGVRKAPSISEEPYPLL